MKTAESLCVMVLTCWEFNLDLCRTSGQQSKHMWNCHQIRGLPAERTAAGECVNMWQDLQGKLEKVLGIFLKIITGDEMWV
jgi:hypothetical protein